MRPMETWRPRSPSIARSNQASTDLSRPTPWSDGSGAHADRVQEACQALHASSRSGSKMRRSASSQAAPRADRRSALLWGS